MTFAATTQLELIFSSDMVRGIHINGVVGEMTVEQALHSMLDNTGLDYRFIDERTVTLVRTEDEAVSQSPMKVLDAVTVSSDSIKRGDWIIGREIIDETPRSYSASHAITATRAETEIKHIPQSIQAIKRNIIDDQQNITVSEALYNVSGIVPRNVLSTPVIEGTLIRGFRSEQLVDGFTQYYNAGDRESTVNIERIEVLKGANAIFYSGGSGSPVGGVVNIVSKLPMAHAFREIGFRGGSHAFYQPFIDLNQPINEYARFRVNAEYTQAGSQIDVLETERFNVNPSLVFTDDENTTLTLQGKLSHWQQQEYQGLPATGTLAGSFSIRPQTFIGPTDIPDSRSDSHAFWGTLAHRINETWSMEIKARYADSEFLEKAQTLFNGTSFIADTPFLPPSTWVLANAELFQQQKDVAFQAYTQARFDYGISENTFMVGVDHSQLKDEGYIDVANRAAGMVDLANPNFVFPYHVPGPALNNQFVENISYGGYFQLQSTFARQVHVLLGLRLGGVEVAYKNRLSGIDSKTERFKVLPRAGLAYDLSDQLTFFAGYSEGMRGQPFVNFAEAPEPDFSRQLEAGIKFDFAQQFNGQVAVYQIDRNRVAVASVENPSEFNAMGHQRSRGIEMDLVWQPFEQLDILANYAHTDARFVDNEAGISENYRLTAVPEDAGRIWANYRFSGEDLNGFSIGLGVYLRSGAYVSNDNQFKVSGYHSFDTTLSYEVGKVKVAATVKNLTDEMYFQPFQYFGGGISGGGRVAPAMGRALYLTALFRF